MRYNIPGHETFDIRTLILDLNGTLSVGGVVPEGVKERLQAVRDLGIRAVLFTGDTRNNADEIATELDIEWELAKTAEEKSDLALKLGPDTCASIGNGRIDLELTKVVKLGIVTLQAEGVYVPTFMAARIVVPTITDALDLFIEPDRLIATMRC